MNRSPTNLAVKAHLEGPRPLGPSAFLEAGIGRHARNLHPSLVTGITRVVGFTSVLSNFGPTIIPGISLRSGVVRSDHPSSSSTIVSHGSDCRPAPKALDPTPLRNQTRLIRSDQPPFPKASLLSACSDSRVAPVSSGVFIGSPDKASAKVVRSDHLRISKVLPWRIAMESMTIHGTVAGFSSVPIRPAPFSHSASLNGEMTADWVSQLDPNFPPTGYTELTTAHRMVCGGGCTRRWGSSIAPPFFSAIRSDRTRFIATTEPDQRGECCDLATY